MQVYVVSQTTEIGEAKVLAVRFDINTAYAAVEEEAERRDQWLVWRDRMAYIVGALRGPAYKIEAFDIPL